MTGASADEVLLITRIRTLNKGNQALSAAWIAMLQKAFPEAPIRVLERRPRHLLQYTLSELARERDPFRTFDALTTKLAKLAPGPSYVGAARGVPKILLDESIAPPARFVALRQRLNLRGLAARAGFYAESYRQRLSACLRAQLVVVNPAGEFYPREAGPAYYHLLDAHVSHKLGRPTAMVNHTMDIADATLRKLIPNIYRSLDLVGFRDEKSIGAFREMGGDMANVLVTPDLALTVDLHGEPRARRNAIAVAINVPEASARGYQDGWIEVIAGLQKKGCQVVLVSNELPADLPFYNEIKHTLGVSIEGAELDYDKYAELLSGFALVVTSRMHTGILSMVAGTPVLPVEGSSFKITGLFQELGLPEQVVRPPGAGWVQQIIDRALVMRDQRGTLVEQISPKIRAASERITRLLVPRLQAAASGSRETRALQ